MKKSIMTSLFLLTLLYGCSQNTDAEQTVQKVENKENVTPMQQPIQEKKEESAVVPDHTVNTVDYLALDKNVTYTVKDNNSNLQYVVSHLGNKIIDGTEVYAIKKSKVRDDGGKEENTDLYAMNENNDILYRGSISNDQTYWEEMPYPFLLGKMELNKEYIIRESANEGQQKLIAKGFEDVKTVERTFEKCLVVESIYEIEGNAAITYKYYLHKDIGIVKEISNENYDVEEVFEKMGDIRLESKKSITSSAAAKVN
ncbi:hypothetical protein [Brevibacillus sp. SYSU BS000544]|uniref:hypothetical protein n=1 Tax=Brevibacillus sp. SYSU BS000544 TaxID=3416443 RepID=UPI003CE46EB3